QVISAHLVMMIFMPLSLDALLVREKLFKNRYVVTLGIILFALGGGVAALAAILSCVPSVDGGSFAAEFFALGEQYPALIFVPAIFLFQAMKLAIRVPLTADMRFKSISLGEFWNGLITMFGGALIVWFYPTVWGLVFAYLVGELFECFWYSRVIPF